MVDLSNLTSQETAAEDARIGATAPVASGATPGFGEGFAASWDENKYYSDLRAGYNSQRAFIQQSLDAYNDQYGEALPNPMDRGQTNDQAAAFATVRQRFADRAAQEPTASPDAQQFGGMKPALSFPNDADIVAGGVALSRRALARASDDAASGGPLATLGAMSAGIVDGATSPLNAAAVAAIPEVSLPLRALVAAGAFGSAQAVQEGATIGYKQEVNPDFKVDDAITDIKDAALGGAAFEVGGAIGVKVLGAAWRRFFAAEPAKAAALPLPVHDAGVVAERASDLDANNPFRTGVTGDAAHNEAVATIDTQIANGDKPELPASAQTELQARTGDVFVPPANDGELPRTEYDAHVRRRAEAIDPETFTAANALDSQIADTRSRVSDEDGYRGQMTAAEPAGWLTKGDAARASELQSNLDALTGRRRASPAAKSMRQELDSLNEQVSAARDEALSRSVQKQEDLRQQLVALQSERGQLGPKVNAATKQAEAEAQAMGLKPVDEAAPVRSDAKPSHSGNPFTPQPGREGPVARGKNAPMPARARRNAKTNGKIAEVLPPPVAAPGEPPVAAPAPAPTPTADSPAFYGSGRSVRVKYELAEARSIITSHDEGFHTNSDYPQNFQPRNRGGKPATAQVFDILNNLDPERLGPNVEANSGAPIIGPDSIVESGNGRSMALRMAYARDGAPGYRAFLERQGFDTSGFKEPVLVGRRVSPMDDAEREAFAQAANGSVALRMTPAEQALADARHLSPDVGALAKGGELTSVANRDFVRAFVAKLPPGEAAGMMTQDGALSAAGVDRLRAAMDARAYGDPAVIARIFDDPDVNIKTIAHALDTASAHWMKMRDAVTAGKLPATQDITEAVMTAVRAVMRARDEGIPVGKVLAQGDMFTSDVTGLAARLFFKDGGTTKFLSKVDMAKNLVGFAEGLRSGLEAGGDIFGAAPRTAEEVLKDTIAASDRRVASLIEASKSSEAIAKALDDPKVEESMFAQLERNIGSGRNKFMSEDAEGNVKVSVADPELLKIQSQEALSKEINACSLPASAEAAE